MELARWLVFFVAFITGIGGLLADYFLASGPDYLTCTRRQIAETTRAT